MKMIKTPFDLLGQTIFILIIFGLLSTVVGLIIYAVKSDIEWRNFANEHQCVLVHEEPTLYITTIANGFPQVQPMPGNKTYHCDNGLDITR
jgi:hypothetical protein